MATTVQLARDYTYRNEDAVRDFLEEHPAVAPVLAEARQVIPHYFGIHTGIVLDVLIDPEVKS